MKWTSFLTTNCALEACKRNFANDARMREWVDVYRQLTRMVKELKGCDRLIPACAFQLPCTNIGFADEYEFLFTEIDDGRCDSIHRSLLTGAVQHCEQGQSLYRR